MARPYLCLVEHKRSAVGNEDPIPLLCRKETVATTRGLCREGDLLLVRG